MSSPKRILSIDGGGIKGVYPASFLASLEEKVGGRLTDYFDLIAGTSTGAILAIGLGLGLTARELRDLYLTEGINIFPKMGWLRKHKIWFTSKHSHAALRTVLGKYFEARKFGEACVRLVIPALDIDSHQMHLFKTRHAANLEFDQGRDAVEVAMASSAAPIYYPPFHSSWGTTYVDGGMCANNPALLAVVEGIGYLGWDRSEIRVLSVGCTKSEHAIQPIRLLGMGLLSWGSSLADTAAAGQASTTLGAARLLIGKDNLQRYDPPVPKGRFELDNAKEMASLRGLGERDAQRALETLRDTYFSEKIEPFIPLSSKGVPPIPLAGDESRPTS